MLFFRKLQNFRTGIRSVGTAAVRKGTIDNIRNVGVVAHIDAGEYIALIARYCWYFTFGWGYAVCRQDYHH